jgi:ribosomal protein S18 acetylase RimI-like enzyme
MTTLVKESLLIRETLQSDRDALVSIIERTSNLTREEKDCAAELLQIYLTDPGQRDYYFITALKEGGPAGYACYGDHSLAQGVYDLYWIVVDEDLKGSGIGRALVEKTQEILCSLSARMIVAETSGLPAYEAARGFYMKCGFSEEARIKDFYKPDDDIVFFVKRLKQKAK